MLGIPPLTIIFLFLMLATMIKHRIQRTKRERRLRNNPSVNEAFTGSWF
jgi:multidrug efflux pump